MALVYVGLDEKAQAITLLEKAHQQRENAVLGLGVYPFADPLRAEPRFQQLLRRIGLPQPAAAHNLLRQQAELEGSGNLEKLKSQAA